MRTNNAVVSRVLVMETNKIAQLDRYPGAFVGYRACQHRRIAPR